MTIFTFSDPVVLVQTIFAGGLTVLAILVALTQRRSAPAFTRLVASVSFGMWGLLCLFESSHHPQFDWPWMAAFYLFSAAMAYYFFRAVVYTVRKFG